MTLAILFDSVGAGEWLVLLAVLLVVMGPKRLPSTARKVGAYYSKFRRAAESFKRQLMDMDLEMEREFQKAEDEAKAMVEGDGQTTAEGDGQVMSEGDGQVMPEGEGQVMPEGEGEQSNGDQSTEES